jgi:predicted transcriptional regulator
MKLTSVERIGRSQLVPGVRPTFREGAADLAYHHGEGKLVAMATRSPREQILDALQDLPADATFDDAIERLVFLAKIDAGLAELDEGKRIPHDEVKRRLGL